MNKPEKKKEIGKTKRKIENSYLFFLIAGKKEKEM